MIVTTTIESCREACRAASSAGAKVAFVPTMGYLHAGHAALLQAARAGADVVVASIFVNPTQFGPSEDLSRYPRDLNGDLDVCREEGVDIVLAPSSTAAMYPPGFQTWVEVRGVTEHFCGASREGHFRGVTTVVAKLFNIVRPDLAVFGEKDFQQLATIRTMVRDLDMDIEIVGVPTVREPDGLALSSRNVNLGGEARARALSIVKGLRAAQAAFGAGERDAATLREACRATVSAGVDGIDYVELADPTTMEPPAGDARARPDTRILVAAVVEGRRGMVRLIDNASLAGEV